MARVTVEDCIERIPNRFELVLIAGQRVRDINSGAAITVERDRDKNPVVALREIADATVEIQDLKEALIKRNQKLFMSSEENEEQIDTIEGEESWANMAREALETENGDEMNFDSEEAEEETEALSVASEFDDSTSAE